MPDSRSYRIRYRVMVWTDETGEPVQVGIARYLDHEKLDERTWAAEPFGSAGELVDDALRALDEQLRLF